MLSARLVTAIMAAAIALCAPEAAAQYREDGAEVLNGAPRADQYRDGPAVLPAPAQADPDAGARAARAAFTSWYRAQNRPRILVYWNRALSDDTATREVERVIESENTYSTRNSTSRSLERTTGADIVTGGARGNLDPDFSRALENAFVGELLSAGATLVDRDTLMRRRSATMGAQDRRDLQYVETLALNERIAYLIEVFPDEDDGSPSGMRFALNVKHLPSATVLAQFSTAGTVAPGPSRYVAGRSGFQRVTEDRNSPVRAAEEAAGQAMAALASAPRR